jgi:enoyl-CoA hydratase/carnithine racemase
MKDIPVMDTVALSVDGGVARLRLNRPDTRNAFNLQLVQDIIEATRWINDQHDIKVVVISGNGAGFSSGFDLDSFNDAVAPETVRSMVARGRDLIETVMHMRPITIAAVHGACVGGGVALAAACDFRYASDDASLFLPETALGIPMAWGSIPFLVREMGPLMATEFALLCETLSAQRALELGMFNDVVGYDHLEQRVSETADVLIKRSSLVLEMTKQQICAAREAMVSGAHSFADAHLLYSALKDADSQDTRADYLRNLKGHLQ